MRLERKTRSGDAASMPRLQLPHTHGCLVCGRHNPHGLALDLFVETEDGRVVADWTPGPQHIGFDRVVHGGMTATVLDEAMVWAATWHTRRFSFCGEMTVRYRSPVEPGVAVRVSASVERARGRMAMCAGAIHSTDGALLAEASGKYLLLDDDRHRAVVATFADDPATRVAAERFKLEDHPT